MSSKKILEDLAELINDTASIGKPLGAELMAAIVQRMINQVRDLGRAIEAENADG